MNLIKTFSPWLFLTAISAAQTVYVPAGTVGNSGNSNAGIGSSSPNQKLSINGGLGFSNQNDLDKKLYSPSDGLLQWMTNNFAGFHGFEISHQGTTIYTHFDTTGISYLAANGGGNVGIGTIAPMAKLHVYGGSLDTVAGASNMLLTLQDNNGNNSLLKVLQIRNNAGTLWDSTTTKILQVTDASNQGYIDFNPPGGAWGMALGSQGNEYIRLQNGGNIGIGTTNPTQKLSVSGTILAKEVIVQTNWADYVFADNYRLPPLSQVEQQIKAEKHLSGIPSAKEISEHGVSMGEMQAKLLAKIEELTLHQIEQEKRIQNLEAENLKLHQARAGQPNQ